MDNQQSVPNIGPAKRRGPFQIGEKIQFTDASGRVFTVTLTEKGWFNVHKGSFPMAQLIGAPEGTVVTSREGREYLAMRPRRLDYTLSMPRGAAIIYPKDSAQIVQVTDIYPGARVFECGVGSGALSINLLNTIGLGGHLVSLEGREEFADIAAANIDIWWGEKHPAWELRNGYLGTVDLSDFKPGYFDRAVLDLLDPWEYLGEISEILRPGGVFTCYITTVTQMSMLVEKLAETGRFSVPEVWETMQRSWHVQGLAVRPDHSMVGHTGFLVTTRLLAPGYNPPQKLKNEIKKSAQMGSQWAREKDWSSATLGQRMPSEKKTKKIRKDAVNKAEYWVRGGSNTDQQNQNPAEANVKYPQD